jgi:hypothetical protein
MKFSTGPIPRYLLCAAAGAVAFGLAACDQQQKPPAARFGKNFEILPPGKDAAGNSAGSRAAVSVDIPDPEDAAIASRVRTALSAEPLLGRVTVTIFAKDGVVTLRGTAESRADRDRAVELALHVDGVYSVNDELIVVRGA